MWLPIRCDFRSIGKGGKAGFKSNSRQKPGSEKQLVVEELMLFETATVIIEQSLMLYMAIKISASCSAGRYLIMSTLSARLRHRRTTSY